MTAVKFRVINFAGTAVVSGVAVLSLLFLVRYFLLSTSADQVDPGHTNSEENLGAFTFKLKAITPWVSCNVALNVTRLLT